MKLFILFSIAILVLATFIIPDLLTQKETLQLSVNTRSQMLDRI